MKRLWKILFVIVFLFALIVFWFWASDKDYFKSNYGDLTEQKSATFKWQEGDDTYKLMERYRQYFFDATLSFPRQNVAKVKLFKNIPMFSVLTVKTLKQNRVDSFVEFCNDSSNFDWGETTWGIWESEYYFQLYNSADKIVGKIYICLDDCFMTDARPFCPAMKFGMLSPKGYGNITTLINSKDNWE